jgi:hypothetical protein
MLKTLILTAALGLLASAAVASPALDAKGKCRDNGRFVAAAMCKAPAPAAAGKCRDSKTKRFAKCSAAGTEPVPSKK